MNKSEAKNKDYDFVDNVKVRISEDKKWVRHILPDQKVVISKSINYYKKILESELSIIGSSDDSLSE